MKSTFKVLIFFISLITLFGGCENELNGYHKVEISVYMENGHGYLGYYDNDGNFIPNFLSKGSFSFKVNFSEEIMMDKWKGSVGLSNLDSNLTDSFYIKASHNGREVVDSKRFTSSHSFESAVDVDLNSLVH